jgi:hypothetical protein
MAEQSDGQEPDGGDGGSGLGAFSVLRNAAKAVWLPISLLFYGLGVVLLSGGRVLTRISGWRFKRGG